MQKEDIKVVELFAGVGGFRLGLEAASDRYKFIWANQWEPGKRIQHAYDCYIQHYGAENHINEDIALVKNQIPTHDLLVGGFPCQDYSVARTQAKGIEGKKGVLWWEINDIITDIKPKYVLLENVDRLLRSPSSQRGRDFGIILRCFNDAGYAVEWRVINAAEYGFAQRRRRVFIFAYRNDTKLYKRLERQENHAKWLFEEGFYANAFPVKNKQNHIKNSEKVVDLDSYSDLAEVSSGFSLHFLNSGVAVKGKIFSEQTAPKDCTPTTLREIRLDSYVNEKYFLNGSLEKWEYLKGAKKINRIRPNGEPYVFAEGGMKFPDDLDLPGRTMLTSESSVNRSTHVIKDAITSRLRLLTPIECERLNGFPDDWTNTGMPERFRYFVMGNALVVPVIKQIGKQLIELI